MRKGRKILIAIFSLVILLLMSILVACGSDRGYVAPYIPSDVLQIHDATPIVEVLDTTIISPTLERIRNATSLEMARHMGLGINLGNTMEACDIHNRIPNRDPSIYEQMWGQPITTQAIITGMRNAGLTTLRIPVAWTNAMDFENGCFIINQAYLNRVEEIVNYALNMDMIVIINAHWDHGWWSMFGHPEQERRDFALEMFIAMWTQIGEHFQYYDYRLILEPSNEEWGTRFNDRTQFSPTGGTLTIDECYELLTYLSQVFIDLIRNQGGYNSTRFLLLKGFNTDVERTTDERFVLPVDTIPNRMLLSVHYYTPWAFCGDTAGVAHWGTTAEVEEMNYLLGSLAMFTEMGIGVVMGEWGVLDNEGDDRLKFFTNFLDNMDLHGFAPVLWDTGFLYCRTTYTISAPEIARLFNNRSRDARDREGLTIQTIQTRARDNMDWTLRRAADRPQVIITADEAFAWIMFSSGDWLISNNVGDVYRPESIAPGLIAYDVQVTGAGTYTVGLDFRGTVNGFADGIAFSAIGIANAEIIFPGYYIEIREVLINGEPVEMSGRPYTTSDNQITSRVNLHNGWVDNIPDSARVYGGDLSNATPSPFEPFLFTYFETLFITFDFVAGSGEGGNG